MKIEVKAEAIRLRKEFGMSINKIAVTLDVSKSTVSSWVNDITLTTEQVIALNKRSNFRKNTEKQRDLAKETRMRYQMEGREMIRNLPIEYALGCGLYWGEGSKEKNALKIANTDPNFILFFKNFLQKYFNVENKKIKIRINYYEYEGNTKQKVVYFWKNLLNLEDSNFYKPSLRNKYYDGYKDENKIKYPNGICTIVVNDTSIVQKIFGGIKEITTDNSDKWIF